MTDPYFKLRLVRHLKCALNSYQALIVETKLDPQHNEKILQIVIDARQDAEDILKQVEKMP